MQTNLLFIGAPFPLLASGLSRARRVMSLARNQPMFVVLRSSADRIASSADLWRTKITKLRGLCSAPRDRNAHPIGMDLLSGATPPEEDDLEKV